MIDQAVAGLISREAGISSGAQEGRGRRRNGCECVASPQQSRCPPSSSATDGKTPLATPDESTIAWSIDTAPTESIVT